MKKLSVWLTLLFLGLLINWPGYNMLLLLVQGDLGRDFYIYEMTLKGAVPYRDYYYTFGPLMPYYYMFWFKWLGVHMPSILIGQIVLKIASGGVIYVLLARYTPATMALLGAVWFWLFAPNFIHTFNNSGTLLAMFGLIYGLLRFNETRRQGWLIGAAVCLTAVTLSKINTGIVCWFAGISSLAAAAVLQDGWTGLRSSLRPAKILTLAFTAAGLIYIILLSGLPWYYIKQCLPLLPGYGQYLPHSPMDALPTLSQDLAVNLGGMVNDINKMSMMSSLLSRRFFTLFLGFGLIWFVAGVFSRKAEKRNIHRPLTAFITLTLFTLAMFHEYLFYLMFYQLYWLVPVVLLSGFFLAGTDMDRMDPVFRQAIYLVLAGIAVLEIDGRYALEAALKKMPQQYVANTKAGVYVKNSPSWINTVEQATDYLKKNLKDKEPFLALPYDPLYYYLSGHPSAVRELVFFKYFAIPEAQEREIIAQLDKQKINYILVSNRIVSREAALGEFGKSHCILLAEYIREHFIPVAEFGPWGTEAEWVANHAVKIYRRR